MKNLYLYRKLYSVWLFAIIVTIACYSCGPKIYFFKVEPETVTSTDSLKINWDVSGEPTLLIHEKYASDDSTIKLMELTLVVQKGDKEIKQFVQVNIVQNVGTNEIIFPTILSGDTLIAAGENNIEKWGKLFEVISVASISNRELIVKHANKTTILDKEGTFSDNFLDTPIEGYWEIRSLVSESEKEDLESLPEDLSINVKYKYKRR